MLCSKCGHQLLENEKFCTSCGAAVNEIENTNKEQSAVKVEKKNTKPQGVVIGIAAVGLTLIMAIVIGLVIIGLFLAIIFADGGTVSDVKDSTLPAYSEDITIEEAFESFFDEPSWSSYETDTDEIVVFTGYFNENGGDKIKITMEMTKNGESLKWEEVVLYNTNTGDTTYLSDVELESLLNAIYENGTFSWYW